VVIVVVERSLPQPMTPAAVQQMAEGGAGCLALHRARHCESYLSPDGLRMTCIFQAPDAESVRIANRQLGAPFDRAWTATLHLPPEPSSPGSDAEPVAAGAREHVIVERHFDLPVAFERIQAMEDAGAQCLDLHGIVFQRTYFARDRQRMLCLYTAPDAEAVRRATRQLGMPFQRIWTALRLGGQG